MGPVHRLCRTERQKRENLELERKKVKNWLSKQEKQAL